MIFPSCASRRETNSPCSDKIATEAQHGLIAQVLKDVIFSSRLSAGPGTVGSVEDVVDATMAIG